MALRVSLTLRVVLAALILFYQTELGELRCTVRRTSTIELPPEVDPHSGLHGQ